MVMHSKRQEGFTPSTPSFFIVTTEREGDGEKKGRWARAEEEQKSLDKNLIKGDTNEKKLFLTLFLQLVLIESI